jgi:hypothetical protein
MKSAGYPPKAAPPSLSLPFQIGNASRHSRACRACPEPAAAGGERGRGELAEWVRNKPSRLEFQALSNRYTLRIEIAVTPSKQTAVVLSNRYTGTPPGRVAFWLPPWLALCSSNRNTPETGIAVTPRKQTSGVLSNRNKKPSPRGVTRLQTDGSLPLGGCTAASRTVGARHAVPLRGNGGEGPAGSQRYDGGRR